MAEDILEQLKSKEDEMEALINEARRKASSIKEDALRKAKEIKSARMKETEEEFSGIIARKTEAAALEAASIEADAGARAGKLRGLVAEQKDKAVKEVVRFINEGLGER